MNGAGISPMTELRLTIRPARCFRMGGSTALVMRIRPNRLTSKRDFACSSDDSSAPATSPTPACVTRRSTRPGLGQHLTHRGLYRVLAGDIAHQVLDTR